MSGWSAISPAPATSPLWDEATVFAWSRILATVWCSSEGTLSDGCRLASGADPTGLSADAAFRGLHHDTAPLGAGPSDIRRRRARRHGTECVPVPADRRAPRGTGSCLGAGTGRP